MFRGKGNALTPVKDGLFGEKADGIRGEKYNHINLSEAMPAPAYKKAIMTLLHLKGDEYDELVTENS